MGALESSQNEREGRTDYKIIVRTECLPHARHYLSIPRGGKCALLASYI